MATLKPLSDIMTLQEFYSGKLFDFTVGNKKEIYYKRVSDARYIHVLVTSDSIVFSNTNKESFKTISNDAFYRLYFSVGNTNKDTKESSMQIGDKVWYEGKEAFVIDIPDENCVTVDTGTRTVKVSISRVSNRATSFNTKKGESTMYKQETVSSMLGENKSAAIRAAKVTAGKVAMSFLKEKIKPQMPMMVRGYVDHPVMDVVLANLLNYADKHTNGKYKPISVAAEVAMDAAYQNLFDSFNLHEFLQELSGKITAVMPVEDNE